MTESNRCTYIFSSLLVLLVLTTSKAEAAVSLQILNHPSEVKIESEFRFIASASGMLANHEFSYKVGVSTGSSYYGYGQVKNDNAWIGYNDTDSCSLAPKARADEAGHWEGEVVGKISSSAKVGNGMLRVRICDPEKSSISYDIKLLEMDKPPEPEPAPEPEPETAPAIDPEPEPESDQPDPSPETLVSNNAPAPKPKLLASKIEYRLPATLSAVTAVLGQSSSSVEASPDASPSASSSATSSSVPKFAIIGGSALLATILTSLYLGRSYLLGKFHSRG